MLKELRVVGIDINTGERRTGTGINFVDGCLYLHDRYVWYEIDPTKTFRIYGVPELDKYPNSKVDEDDISVLQERLMQTAIDVCKERNLDEIEEISFGVDDLQASVEFGSWAPSTDSSLRVIGYHDNKRKEIGYTI